MKSVSNGESITRLRNSALRAIDAQTDPVGEHMARADVDEGGDTVYRRAGLLADAVGLTLSSDAN
jgi:hypothetical protein